MSTTSRSVRVDEPDPKLSRPAAITYNTETGQPSRGYRASPSAARLSICVNLKTKVLIASNEHSEVCCRWIRSCSARKFKWAILLKSWCRR